MLARQDASFWRRPASEQPWTAIIDMLEPVPETL